MKSFESQTGGTEQVKPKEKTPEPKEVKSQLADRLKHFKSPMLRMLLLASLAINSNDVPPIEQPTTQTTEYTPLNAPDLYRNEIRETLGETVLDRLEDYSNAEADLTAYREEIRNPEHPQVQVSGFEQIGYSSEQIQAVLSAGLPESWLSARNLSQITVSSEELPTHRSTDGTESSPLGSCSTSFTPGEPSEIHVNGPAFNRMAQGPREALLLRMLLHEATHANDPINSSTLDEETRLWAYDWLSHRVTSQQATEETTVLGSDIHSRRIRNIIMNGIGEEDMMPNPGEGALPFAYASHGFDREHQVREYFAETVSVVLTLPEAPSNDRPWEEETALQLMETRSGDMNMNWRNDEEAFADALEHIHFLQRLIPDLEERQRALRTTVSHLSHETQ